MFQTNSGFGLGFVNLGKGRDGSSCLGEDGFDGILRRFVVGGPKPTSSSNGGKLQDLTICIVSTRIKLLSIFNLMPLF